MILFKLTNEILSNKFYKFKAYNLKNGKTNKNKNKNKNFEAKQRANRIPIKIPNNKSLVVFVDAFQLAVNRFQHRFGYKQRWISNSAAINCFSSPRFYFSIF